VTAKPDLPIIPFASRDAWGAWLEGQHATSDGLWLKFAKKYSGLETVTYDQAVEIALCYGWIDGQVRSFDEDYYLQRFTPRRPRSRCTPQGPNPEQPGWPTSSNHRLGQSGGARFPTTLVRLPVPGITAGFPPNGVDVYTEVRDR
jgi:hypothetical protein